ncbi:uncharacterized protein LOC131650024 [Vicia villosa]|uniref:uncharacterized protein LOC131650024 n=1 Tax=Vicia villosa TaxID=3911 RepID=UPI00273C92AA|nr:uncharacterized protein LOC131650024 [Vicia villosa]
MGRWIEGKWVWGDLGLPENLLAERGLERNNLLLRESLLHSVGPKDSLVSDEVWWKGDAEAEFTVASCYDFYERCLIPFGPYGKHDEAFHFVWKADVPYNIKAFGWRLLLDRLPTKESLVRRGIPLSFENSRCTLCDIELKIESISFLVVKWLKRFGMK